MKLIKRYLDPGRGSFFLFGPRGCGKSLWVKETFKDALYIDFLEPESFRFYSAYPERLNEVINANPHKKNIVIDEIQKVPDVLSVIHKLMEERKDLRFIMTGSSSRKIKKTGGDLLAGRAVSLSLHPFMASELGEEFDFDKALNYGLIPLVYFSYDLEKTIKSYIALYIKEEIQSEALVRNIPAFTRFLESLSFSQASVLNISSVARDCLVERKTVEGYVKILEDLLLCFKLDVFSKRAKRKLISHSKIYFFDVGVYRSLRPKGLLDRPDEIDGVSLESLIAQNLYAWIYYRNKDNKLYYWRTIQGIEVDFVVYGEDGIFAIEVKNSDKIHPEFLKGLKSFKEDYDEAKCIFLYRGKERIIRDGILCIPCNEFLLNLRPEDSISKFWK